jgi:hypothetical protein
LSPPRRLLLEVCTRRSFVTLPARLTHAFKPNPSSLSADPLG